MRPIIVAAAVAGLSLSAYAQAATPPAKRNFVPLDDTFNSLIDTASIRRDGDSVTFDLLSVSAVTSFSLGAGAPSDATATYTGSLASWRIACARRSGGTVGKPTPYNADGTVAEGPRGMSDQAEEFMLEGSWRGRLADRMCAARMETWPKGSADVTTALKAATDARGPLAKPTGPLAIGRAPPRPIWADWMPQGGFARFWALAPPQPGGGGLFLQGGSASGDKVEAVTFQVLDQAAHRATTERDNAAVMQLVQYDCTGRTRQILRQASWNRFGRLQTVGDTEGAAHPASESPLLDAEITAACATAPGTGPTFDGYDTAWASVRAGWRPAPKPVWTGACVDKAMPAEGNLYGKQAPTVEKALAACGVTADNRRQALSGVRALRNHREAAVALKAAGLDEKKVLAAWRALTWADRQLVIKNRSSSLTYDREDEAVVMAGIHLELNVTDYAAMQIVTDYIEAQARMEQVWPEDL